MNANYVFLSAFVVHKYFLGKCFFVSEKISLHSCKELACNDFKCISDIYCTFTGF